MASEHLEQLLRWVGAGGTLHVLARPPGAVEVALLTCSGGDEMARLRSAEPDVLAFVVDVDPRR